MELLPRHLQAIQLLTEQRFRASDTPVKMSYEIAAELSVRPETLSRWQSRPAFKAALQESIAAARVNHERVRYAPRVQRIDEIRRLYEVTPDYVDDTTEITTEGRTVVKFKRTWLTLQKAKILAEIRSEMDLGEMEAESASVQALERKVEKVLGVMGVPDLKLHKADGTNGVAH